MNSGRGLSAREEGLTTSVGDPGSADPGSGSAYFYRDPDPQIRDPDPRIFTGFQSRDPGSAIRAKNSADLQHCNLYTTNISHKLFDYTITFVNSQH